MARGFDSETRSWEKLGGNRKRLCAVDGLTSAWVLEVNWGSGLCGPYLCLFKTFFSSET